MIRTHIELALLWILFCVMHSFFAGRRIKNLVRKILKKKFIHFGWGYSLFAFLNLAILIFIEFNIGSIFLFSTRWSFSIAFGLTGISGVALMGFCIRQYFSHKSGISNIVNPDLQDELIMTGIHAYCRHPLYLGTFLFIWSLWLIFPTLTLLISNAIITLYTLIGIHLEEKKLILKFGETYWNYKKEVPMLLPLRFSNRYFRKLMRAE